MKSDMEHFDAIVIGGGILGCFTTRNLRKWNISTLLLEKEEDVCSGITRANSAICYAGYDNKPGSLKAELTVRGNANMTSLCEELDVPFSRCGSLLVTYDEETLPWLERKLQNGIENGVPALRLISGTEAEAMEPLLKRGIKKALYAPTTGTLNPWRLGIAAFENALDNGAVALMSAKVLDIRKVKNDYEVRTEDNSYLCRMVFNCAGLYADRVQELIFPPSVRLYLDAAEYLVMDVLATKPSRVIFHQTPFCGKGITTIPCVEGNLLISGMRKPMKRAFATTPEGLKDLHSASKELLPDLNISKVIRSFAAVRPNPYLTDGTSMPDFCIENPAPGFYSLIGIKTPGLTACNELGLLLAEKAATYLGAETNSDFECERKGVRQKDSEIICQCEKISKAEIVEAIRRGASNLDGVKRRVGSAMGRCQGSRCSFAIERILEEYRNGAI